MNQPTFSKSTKHYAMAANDDPSLFDPYYNTVELEQKDIKDRRSRFANQTSQIMDIFKSNPDQMFTPFDVEYRLLVYHPAGYPITSIRRCITNLTSDGKLIKTDQKRKGKYGDLNFCWKLKP